LLKAAGAAGLLLGLAGVPLVGPAAALGLTLFFVGAVVTHLRAGDHALAFPVLYLALAVASLVLGLAA
jgi:DoxX-like family